MSTTIKTDILVALQQKKINSKAMNQKFIYVFFLLIMISIINAIPYQFYKRATQFTGCSDFPSPTFTMSVSPDPIITGGFNTFTFSGTLPFDVAKDSSAEFSVTFLGSDGKILDYPHRTLICDITGSNCPINQGTTFTLSWGVLAPKDPATTIQVQVKKDSKTSIMCVNGVNS